MPIHALQSVGLSGDAAPLSAIQDMAAHYLAEVRKIQSHGPYRLLGYSFGGLIAYELAHQLMAAGEAVSYLGLIDTTCNPAPTAPDSTSSILRMSRLAGLAVDEAEIEAIPAGERFAWLAKLACDESAVLPCDAKQYFALLVGNHVANNAYQPPRSSLPVHLITAVRNRLPHPNPTLGWDAVARNLHVSQVDAFHNDIIVGPQASQLTKIINEALEAGPPMPCGDPNAGYDALVPLQYGREGQVPAFLIPGAGSTVACFRHLVEALGAAMPVYGLQPRGLLSPQTPHPSIEAMARDYLAAIQGVRGNAPVRLVGHSFGGQVAFEMARQLEQAGVAVAPLVLLDARSPLAAGAVLAPVDRIGALVYLARILGQAAGCDLGLTPTALHGLAPDGQVALLREKMIGARLAPPGMGMAAVGATIDVFHSHINTAYRPRAAYAGRSVLIQAASASQCGEGTRLNWASHAAHLQCWTSPGDHMSMLNAANSPVLAGLLAAAWAREGGSC